MGIDPGLRRLALSTLLAAFPGPIAPDWAVDLVTAGLAGYVLFGSNIAEPHQIARLTAELRTARPNVLIATDEEGGDVTRLAHRTGSPYPGNAALGQVNDPSLTQRLYTAIGRDLAAVGITVDLAPTIDVNSTADNPIIGTRSFGAHPALVSAHARAAVIGLQSAGIVAVAKHFPGHGATVVDSHLGLPLVDASLSLLRERDLPPFAAAIEAGVPAIMTAHICVPALTGDAPATFSRQALQDVLRRELGFTGVIVTDALEMAGAARSAGGIPSAAVRALAAGADLLCLGARTAPDLIEAVVDQIISAIRDGHLPVTRLENAATRVAGLPRKYAAEFPREGTAREAELALGVSVARLAVRIEGSFTGLGVPLVVRLVTSQSMAVGKVPWGLAQPLDGVDQLDVFAAEASAEAIIAAAGSRWIVVVGRALHRFGACQELIDRLAAAHPVVVIEMGWPGQWRPVDARAFVTTYGASLASGRAAAELLSLIRWRC